jgi:hypothetical protein
LSGAEPPRYRFGPLERRGLIAGWRGGQIASVAGGLAVAVLALRVRSDLAGVVVAVLVLTGCAGFAFWPIGGRTAEEWTPTVVRWTLGGPRSRRVRRSPAPQRGTTKGRPSVKGPQRGGRGARRPGPFDGLELMGVHTELLPPPPSSPSAPAGSPTDNGSGPLAGMVHDALARTFTAVLAVRGHSFALLGTADKERRVGSWASVLGALAREGSLVHRLQWIAVAVPDDGRAVRRHVRARAVISPEDPAARSYAALLDGAGAAACRHEVLLAVQIQVNRASARAVRAAGGGAGGAAAVLLREVASLRRLLGDADVVVEGLLDPDGLARAVRRSGEAHPVTDRSGGWNGADERTGPSVWPWPMAVDPEWGRLRTDGTWHTTYWVAEWPRVEVGPEFLGPLLLGSARRSVAVVMEPVSPARATRQVEQSRTADLADSELRRRGGFLATARRQREADIVASREAELADGHGSFRYSGYVTVTAVTPEALDDACEATEQAAGQCRLELRRLYGDQDTGFTCTLPLARGLS